MYTIRRAVHADCLGIGALLADWHPDSAWEYLREEARLGYDFLYLTATGPDGRVVGFLQGMLDSMDDEVPVPREYPVPRAFAVEMCVAEARRGQGIGAALLHRFGQEAAAAGLSYLLLGADGGEGHEQRVRFFLRFGLASLDSAEPKWLFGAPIADLIGDTPLPDLRRPSTSPGPPAHVLSPAPPARCGETSTTCMV